MTASKIWRAARSHRKDMVAFLRDMIAIPGESRREEAVIRRIKREMAAAGFDEIIIDRMGNIRGRIGRGKTVVAMDAHVDTVGVGSPDQWKWDPYRGRCAKGIIYGRGAVDQRAGMASMVYAGKMIKECGLLDDFSLWVVGSVQEEDADGLCWQYLVREEGFRPDCVVITEPTNLNLYIGQRGRMEIKVHVAGRSAHGSAPHRGRNAVYLMSRVVSEIEQLGPRLKSDPFLGRGTVAVTHIDCRTPSLCAVPDGCAIHLDRRLTAGETKASALAEVRAAAKRAKVKARVFVNTYDLPGWRGLRYRTDCYYPAWALPRSHPLLKAGREAYRAAFGSPPKVDKWTFSTNGVATMGLFRIPTIGFGPGNEIYAHQVDEQVPADHLVKAAVWYALFPGFFLRSGTRR